MEVDVVGSYRRRFGMELARAAGAAGLSDMDE